MKNKNYSETRSNGARMTKIRPASAEIWTINNVTAAKQTAFRFAASAAARG